MKLLATLEKKVAEIIRKDTVWSIFFQCLQNSIKSIQNMLAFSEEKKPLVSK
jgi:hypothetical protein